MGNEYAADYALTDEQAATLSGAVGVSADFRRQILAKHTKRELVEMFAQFVGLANSVVANNREMVELLLITEGNMHPHSAEKANLPTIMGALWGVPLAAAAAGQRTCAGCAFRLGTPANQSPATTCDADWTTKNGREVFMCHEHVDDRGNPTNVCPGFGRARKRRLARP